MGMPPPDSERVQLHADHSWMTEHSVKPLSRSEQAAADVAVSALLNCYMREGGEWHPMPASSVPELAQEGDTFIAVVPFPDERATVIAGVRHLSPTHRHRFRLPAEIAMAGGKPLAISLDTLAGMLADELGDTGLGDDPTVRSQRGPDPTLLLSRVRESVRSMSAFLDARAGAIDALWSADPLSFIDSEQALLLGRMAHPTSQSRWGMTPAQVAAYAPETQARFALQWLAIEPSLVEHDSATGTAAPALTEQLLRSDPAVDGAALDAALEGLGERVLMPIHPFELDHLRAQEHVAALIGEGLIVELGALGSEVTPTSSVNTVYNADWPWQLKFSLHAQLTDAMRFTRKRELQRTAEAARLADSEIGRKAAEIAPDLVLLQDPAHLAVVHNGAHIDGLSVVLRENRWAQQPAADVTCVEVLVQDHPYDGASRLARIVEALAQESGRSEEEVAREWFGRYLEIVVASLARLYLDLGLYVETDHQNTLLELDGGWPARAVLRDSQAFRLREAASEDIGAVVPGIGADSGAIRPESEEDRALAGYAFFSDALNVINALGVAGCIDEVVLLGDLRTLLERERERGGRYPATVIDRVLDGDTWPLQAHFSARLHEAGDVYAAVSNPLHGVPR